VNVAPKNDRLVWVDLEMTGLDPDRHVIVEIAALVTDANLQIIGEGVDLVVHATEEELAEMDDFVTNMHESSGLTEQIRTSTVPKAWWGRTLHQSWVDSTTVPVRSSRPMNSA